MAVPFVKINYTPPGGSTVQITDHVFSNNQRGVDLKSGRCSFRVNNSPYRQKSGGSSIFTEDGVVEMFADYAPITEAASQLLFSGQIRELKPSIGEQGSSYEVTSADRTVLLLGKLESKPFNTATPIDQIIKTVVSAAGSVGGATVSTTNVASSRVNGSAFPSVTYSPGFKPVSEWISELSQPGYTGEDRSMMFYVDKTNDLHWFYPSQTPSRTLTEGTDEIYNWRMSRNSDAVVNFIIYNAGNDLNGNGILWYTYDKTSRTSTFKMKYYPFLDITNALFDSEISAANLTQSSSGTIPYKGKLYVAKAYPFTPSWAGASSVANFTEYNNAFRDAAKSIANTKANSIIGRLGKLCWSGSCELKGNNNYVAGDLVTCNSASLGLTNYKLRVVDVQHTFDSNGWITTLELKEDEAAAVATS